MHIQAQKIVLGVFHPHYREQYERDPKTALPCARTRVGAAGEMETTKVTLAMFSCRQSFVSTKNVDDCVSCRRNTHTPSETCCLPAKSLLRCTTARHPPRVSLHTCFRSLSACAVLHHPGGLRRCRRMQMPYRMLSLINPIHS